MLTFSRITPRQVVSRATKGERIAFVDARGDDAFTQAGLQLTGAVRVRPESIVRDAIHVPRGCAVVVYGRDERDVDVARVAEGLRAQGFREVRVLAGGFSAWVELRYAVQPAAAA
ncbi:MAG TPA: rhodanese-like domain-containing protein [Anaeromyxobacter sp.]|nr:rhodanese-like domain-containing protein [Anaeromyxobacter sp.]